MRNDENTFRSDLKLKVLRGSERSGYPQKGGVGGYPPGGGGGPKHSELPTTLGQNDPPPLAPRGGWGGYPYPKK